MHWRRPGLYNARSMLLSTVGCMPEALGLLHAAVMRYTWPASPASIKTQSDRWRGFRCVRSSRVCADVVSVGSHADAIRIAVSGAVTAQSQCVNVETVVLQVRCQHAPAMLVVKRAVNQQNRYHSQWSPCPCRTHASSPCRCCAARAAHAFAVLTRQSYQCDATKNRGTCGQ